MLEALKTIGETVVNDRKLDEVFSENVSDPYKGKTILIVCVDIDKK